MQADPRRAFTVRQAECLKTAGESAVMFRLQVWMWTLRGGVCLNRPELEHALLSGDCNVVVFNHCVFPASRREPGT